MAKVDWKSYQNVCTLLSPDPYEKPSVDAHRHLDTDLKARWYAGKVCASMARITKP